jgi:hypoxia up-regulated 1
MFYDMGAGTTTATLVSFHSGSDTKQGIKNLVDLEVVGFDVDLSLGGNVIDRRLQQHLANEFLKKYPKHKLNERAMERLLKEANRCKTILSANDNVFAGVEGLVDGIDFKLEVSRKTLESLSDDLFSRVTTPIKNVLKGTDVKLEQIQSMVLFGGSVRVPGVQKVLEEFVGKDKIARNVDGDEAAVFGAVLHAAAVSSQFRLGQTMRIKDINPVPVNVWYDSSKTSKKINTNLFTKKSVLGTKKLMTFKKVEDFEFGIGYD